LTDRKNLASKEWTISEQRCQARPFLRQNWFRPRSGRTNRARDKLCGSQSRQLAHAQQSRLAFPDGVDSRQWM